MLPNGFTTSSSNPWNAQIGTAPNAQRAVAHAGRPSPAIGTAAATAFAPNSDRYSHVPNPPQLSPVRYTRFGSTSYALIAYDRKLSISSGVKQIEPGLGWPSWCWSVSAHDPPNSTPSH